MNNQQFALPVNSNRTIPIYGNYPSTFNPLPQIPFNGYDPKTMFSNNNFQNRNDLLYNNLNNILLNEEIREYSVMIDSKDRNYQVFPDPFCYEVTFNPLPKTKEKVNGKTVTYETPNPVINDNFTNVRYIKLEDVILPFYTKVRRVKEVVDGEIVINNKVDVSRPLTEYLYTVLSLGDYQDINYRSTNDVLGDSFATIYYDSRMSDTHFRGYPGNGLKIFPQDQLAKIDKLKIRFMDPYGRQLRVNHVDKSIQSGLECTCEGDEENENCFRHNLFHPLNPIFQHHLHFKIGIVEPRLNKKTFN